MSGYPRPASRNDYKIAVICALRSESDAVEAVFDEDWEHYSKIENDTNAYSTGRIGVHNIVLAFMPGIGKANSAKHAGLLHTTFPQIKLGLVVGICGGVPIIRESIRDSRDIDVFLGDIIISTEVFQYDLGHQYSNEFVTIDTLQNTLGRPSDEIRAFLHKMQGLKGRERLEDKTRGYLAGLLKRKGFEKSTYQGVDKDILYKSTYRHKHHESTDCVSAICKDNEDRVCNDANFSTCEDLKCDTENQVLRNRLKMVGSDAANQTNASNIGAEAPRPRVHFGAVASGDSVVRSAHHRDKQANSHEVIGFEMEGAGAWGSIPTVVIKSVTDYADSHKSYRWQKYGAACAAACMKAFVSEWMLTDKTVQLGAWPGPHGLPQAQSGESSGVTREESETQSKRAKLDKNVDKAYILLDRRDKDTMKGDLEDARGILSQAEVESRDLDSSLRPRIYWGLMAVEKELSCYEGYEITEKIEHIKKAQKSSNEVEKIVSRSSDASLQAQVSLEQHIIKGRMAVLGFEIERDVERTRELKSEAINGIDASLKNLQEVDLDSYNQVFKAAMKWRKEFSS